MDLLLIPTFHYRGQKRERDLDLSNLSMFLIWKDWYIRDLKRDDRHLGRFKAFNVRPMNGNKGTRTESFASVLNSNHPNNLPSSNKTQDSSLAIVLDDDCLSVNDLSCAAIGEIKGINALLNLSVILNDEGFDNVKISYLGGFVWTAIEGLPMCAWNNEALSKIVSPWGTLAPVDLVEDNSLPYRKVCVATIVSTIINNRIKIIVKGKVYWTRIRELEPLSPEFDDEFCESSSDDESVGEEKNSPSMDDVPDHVTESSFMNENSKNVINGQESPQDKSSEDPFGIYNIINKQDIKMIFNETGANAFNHFISTAGLIDLPLEGYSFTWSIKSAKKMSKLDRLIIMREVVADYGPSPFRVYQSWFYKKGMAQKAKVRWAIEGDENSKYFHGIINKKRSQLAIHGVITDGEWIDEPCKVKNEFLKHLANQFECPSGPCIDIDSDMFKKLSTEQVADLECD
nr:hypothetical protein [Tanacetum cinerariifolium]